VPLLYNHILTGVLPMDICRIDGMQPEGYPTDVLCWSNEYHVKMKAATI
jgi:hypothetical protein